MKYVAKKKLEVAILEIRENEYDDDGNKKPGFVSYTRGDNGAKGVMPYDLFFDTYEEY